jgi:hypothetical protein
MTEPPTEKFDTKCPEQLKAEFRVSDKLRELQAKYPKFIKSFDINKRN